jgi:uncharacterized protein (TIGR03086 family)
VVVIDPTEALEVAGAGFADRLRLVKPGDWERPTPCTEWDVRALVNHVVGGNVRYTMLLHGAPEYEVEATRAADNLGEDPVASFLTTAAEVLAAFGEEGALSRVARHGSGERTGAELLVIKVLDVAVHGWDLAVAIGGDQTIAPEVVALLLERPPDLAGARQLGAFAQPSEEDPVKASPQARLLQMVGRVPRSD